MTKLTAELVHKDNQWTLKFIGEVDFATAQPMWLSGILDTIAKAQAQTLIIDLTATKLIDSQGLRLLLDIQKACSQHGIQVMLQNPNHHLHRLFRIMQFSRLFVIETGGGDLEK